MKVEIIPSILVPDKRRFLQRWNIASRYVNKAQIDVLDGSLLPYKSFSDPVFINSLRPALSLEVHLMVADAEKEIFCWNYRWVEKIIFHPEAVKNPAAAIKQIKLLGKKVGLAINPGTPIASVSPFLKRIDTVLVMTVQPGRNAAPFIPSAVKKIKRLRFKNRRLNIGADGGIKPRTARLCAQAGANLLVVGSYLKSRTFKARLESLKQSLSQSSNEKI